MISTVMGITAVKTSVITVLKLIFIVPRNLVSRKYPPRMVNKIHKFQRISFFMDQLADENFLGKRLGNSIK
jgi:hypothetical protein